MSDVGSRVLHPDAADLLNALHVCRRRLVFVAFVRHLPVALAVATAGTALWTWLDRPVSLAALTGVVLIGFVCAAGVAVVRRPSAATTAAAIDNRLGLPQTVAAGLEHQDADDPWGRLVVRDAAARTRTLRAGQLFPVTLSSRHYASLAAVVLSGLAIGLVQPRPDASPEPSAGPRPGGMASAAGRAPAGLRPLAANEPAAKPVSAVPVPSASPATGATASAGEREQRPDADSASRQHERPPSADAQSPAMSSSSPAASAASSRSDHADAVGVQPGAGANASGSERTGAPLTASGRATSAASAAGRGAGRGGAGAAGGGSLTGRTAPATSARVTGSRSSPAPAGAAVEAAIVRDDVPPQDRALVRRYFTALGALDRE